MILNIPPFEIFGENIVTYDQIKRSFYFWYFQLQRVIETVDRGERLRVHRPHLGRLVAGLRRERGSAPGQGVHPRARAPAGGARLLLGPVRPDALRLAGLGGGAGGGLGLQPAPADPLPPRHDGRLPRHDRRRRWPACPSYCGPGSESELIEGVGHFMLVERPAEINERITGFLARTA